MFQPQIPIHHLATGGTLDSHWSASDDTAIPRRESVVGSYFRDTVRYRSILSKTLFMKDSRQMTAEDQDHVADKVAETAENRIIVTTGTFLIPDIARAIKGHPMANHFDDLNRRVILTGALTPMTGFLKSDGGFNLGMSVAVLQQETVDRVSVVMNGACFRVSNLRKDLTKATFSSSAGDDQMPYDSFDLITAGGSIDFEADGLDRLVPDRASSIPDYLRESVKIGRKFHSVNPFVKDSRALQEKDRQTILDMVERSKTDNVLVTTGMYKIGELRNFMEEKLGEGNKKRVVITASRIPLGLTDATDAPFNLGHSLGSLPFLEPGVYVCINGMIFREKDDNILEHVFSTEEIRAIEEQSRAFQA